MVGDGQSGMVKERWSGRSLKNSSRSTFPLIGFVSRGIRSGEGIYAGMQLRAFHSVSSLKSFKTGKGNANIQFRTLGDMLFTYALLDASHPSEGFSLS